MRVLHRQKKMRNSSCRHEGYLFNHLPLLSKNGLLLPSSSCSALNIAFDVMPVPVRALVFALSVAVSYLLEESNSKSVCTESYPVVPVLGDSNIGLLPSSSDDAISAGTSYIFSDCSPERAESSLERAVRGAVVSDGVAYV
mmetsp:Transcript_4119/g.8307  ORF Transcript_4119/g.8307 Transcript_4119/m.8307 type:complete len:141 (-) Transcript_4119:874-1296(-)